MTQTVHVPLTDDTYQRIKLWARHRQREISEAIADYLTETLPPLNIGLIPLSAPDPAVAREKAAYIRLFPELKKQFDGEYVAIYQGQLVDNDPEYGALFERIEENYPDVFVWLTQVEDEPIGTITLHSPLFLED